MTQEDIVKIITAKANDDVTLAVVYQKGVDNIDVRGRKIGHVKIVNGDSNKAILILTLIYSSNNIKISENHIIPINLVKTINYVKSNNKTKS